MRVAFVTELFAPSIGGQEYRYHQLASGLASAGVDVDVLTADFTGGSLPLMERRDGISVRRYVNLVDYVRSGSRSTRGLVRYAFATRRLLLGLARDYDAVVVNEMPLAHLALLPRRPNILIDWCESTPGIVPVSGLRALARRFRHHITVDGTVADDLGSTRSSSRWSVVRTPMALDRYTPTAKEPGLIVYLGRLVPHKNVDQLAEAVAGMPSNGADAFRLSILGDGPLRSVLERRYRGHPRVQVLGHVEESEKCRLLRRAWLCALPSRREGLPNAALEAVASGTPLLTIASPQNGLARFVAAQDIGTVAPSAEPTALARATRGIRDADWMRWAGAEERLRAELRFAPNVDRLTEAIEEVAACAS